MTFRSIISNFKSNDKSNIVLYSFFFFCVHLCRAGGSFQNREIKVKIKILLFRDPLVIESEPFRYS